MTTYTHPDDIDLDEATSGYETSVVRFTLAELTNEIIWLRGQRSTLATALDRIDRGDGGDPVSIAATAIAATGLARENQTTGGTGGEQ